MTALWFPTAVVSRYFPYGTLLLMRWMPVRLTLHPLPTRLWRSLLVAEFESAAGTLAVATVHLESMARSESIRAAQLSEIFRLLAPFPQAVLVGDFNFCAAEREENARLDPAYVDLWPALRSQEPGYTEDTTVNAMLRRIRGEDVQVRYDRILFRASATGWQGQAIDRLGLNPLPNTVPALFVSDHFGLVATLAV